MLTDLEKKKLLLLPNTSIIDMTNYDFRGITTLLEFKVPTGDVHSPLLSLEKLRSKMGGRIRRKSAVCFRP